MVETTTKRLCLREAETAKDFCEDYLNNNIREVLHYQIREMEGSSATAVKTAGYYRALLQRIVERG